MQFRIIEYHDKYKDQIIDLILEIQNDEYSIDLSINEQSDLLNIKNEYISNGGNFWIAVDSDDNVVGTIALLKMSDEVAVLKKFFVDSRFRGGEFGIGSNLYGTLLSFVEKNSIKHVILDTPAVATRSHNFYKKVGFRLIGKEDLPIEYTYPDRNSLLFILDL